MDYIWVVYAGESKQFHLQLDFQEGMTIQQAISQSGLLDQVTLPDPLHVGIFGQQISDLDRYVHCGDRIEIYRPLKINPKDIRRNRAAKNSVGCITKGNRFKQLS